MTVIIDGRGRRGSGINSDRLWQNRAKSYAREAFQKAIEKTLDGDIKSIGNQGVSVPIPKKGVDEPFIHTDSTGVRRQVRPGNKEFQAGDTIPRPKSGGGGGGGAGEGDGESGYMAHLDKEEVRRMFFEGLGLPYLDKKSAEDIRKTHLQRSGLSLQGPFHNIDLSRTKKRMLGRAIASSSSSWDSMIELLQEKQSILTAFDPMNGQNLAGRQTLDYVSKPAEIEMLEEDIAILKSRTEGKIPGDHEKRLVEIDVDLEGYKSRVGMTPYFNDSLDPRYKRHEQMPIPQAKAVMFCLMDVSGSMSETMKKNAKVFFSLLYNLLSFKYGDENVDIVFIRHTDAAEEVDQETFFNGDKTGGTKVSAALMLKLQIMKERYSGAEWNIYGAQVSDGDNLRSDNPEVEKLMPQIMKLDQAFCYMETNSGMSQGHSDLWPVYQAFATEYGKRFKMGKVADRKDVVPIFRELYAEEAPGYRQRVSAFEPA